MSDGEELGSGVLNVSKYLPLYAKGAKPQFVEGNPETFAQPHKTNNFVIPAKAGIQYYQWFSGYRPSPV
jgi:hypothetical protein